MRIKDLVNLSAYDQFLPGFDLVVVEVVELFKLLNGHTFHLTGDEPKRISWLDGVHFGIALSIGVGNERSSKGWILGIDGEILSYFDEVGME